MPISRTKDQLDQLDIYNRILRQENYLIGLVNRETIPMRFQLPGLDGAFIYLPNYYLLNLKLLLFWAPKCPFANYCQLRQEYKFLGGREKLAEELAKQSRIIGLVGLILSPLAFLVQLLMFLFTNAQRLRYEPAQLFGRSWSNYARLYLRHFNELQHEFEMRLRQAYNPAGQYLDCFPSRLLSTIATHVAFTLGGASILLFVASLFRESLIHLTGYLAAMAIGGLIARVCFNLLPTEDMAYFPQAKLLATLARIHYMPDYWKENAHSHVVRSEFAQLFQLRIVGALEEIFSPLLAPLIMLFCVPKCSLEIVDFLRNFSVDLPGVGDVCSFAQLDLPRHGDPEWSPMEESSPESPSSGDEEDEENDDSDDNESHGRGGGRQQLPAVGGKTELSLVHFYHTNPTWNMPENSRVYLTSVRRQAHDDMQRRQQIDLFRGMPLYSSLYGKYPHPSSSSIAVAATGGGDPSALHPRPLDQFCPPSDHSTQHVKNVAHLPTLGNEPLSLGVGSAIAESIMKIPSESTTAGGELSPKRLTTSRPPLHLFGMAQSGLYPGPNQVAGVYQPYTSQMEDRPFQMGDSNYTTQHSFAGSASFGEMISADMDMSTMYLHEMHQRRRNQHRASQPSLTIPHSVSSSFRQRSFTAELFTDEIRYQQPASSGFRFSAAGRVNRLGASVGGGGGIRQPGRRQCEEVVEEEEVDSNSQRTSTTPTNSPAVIAELQSGPSLFGNRTVQPIDEEEVETVRKWPKLPPTNC